MLVILLLISQTTCEWVEISQNYYKQDPPRKAIHQSTKIKHEDTSKYSSNYRNNSEEKQWNKGIIDRVSNVGDIRRVDVPQVKTPSKPRPADDFYEHTNDATDLENQRQVSIYKPLHKDMKLNIHNRENTKQNPTYGRRKISTNENRYNQNLESDENKIFNVQGSSTTERYSSENNDLNKDIFKGFQRISNPKNYNLQSENKATIIFTTTAIPKTEKIKEIFGSDSQKEFFKSENDNEANHLKGLAIMSDIFSNKTITNKQKFQVTDEFFENIEDHRITTILSTTPTSKTLSRIDFKSNVEENAKLVKEMGNKEDHIDHNFEDNSNEIKIDTMSGMWKLMKAVSDTIYKNTHRSFKSKVKYLEGLKTTIITSIEEYVESVWPDDMEHRGSARRVRSAQARGHLEIPSSESTLMTISFLTFAVFVIKLVLQVIHTYKNKTMMVTPTLVAAVGRAAAAIRSKQ